MSRNYEELARQRVFASEVEDTLFAVNRGEIARFAFIRKLQKPTGEFWFSSDEIAVWRACRDCGIPTERLEEWRIQYDALPQPNP